MFAGALPFLRPVPGDGCATGGGTSGDGACSTAFVNFCRFDRRAEDEGGFSSEAGGELAEPAAFLRFLDGTGGTAGVAGTAAVGAGAAVSFGAALIVESGLAVDAG